MADIELEDLIVTYPSIESDDIQRRITAKHEFAELASSSKEGPPKPGEFFKHQKLIQRYAKVWDRAIVVHETGTGKSYMNGALGEIFRIAKKDNRGIRHVLILVKGDTQRADAIKTLICKSTNNHYITPALLASGNSQSVKNNTTRALGQWYTIKNYGAFANKLRDKTDAELEVMFSDYLIIIDEIHNLRQIFSQEDQEYREDREAPRRVNLETERYIYETIWRVTHIPKRIKVFGMTASVIINSPNEFVSVANLVLPMNRQIPAETDIENISFEDLYVFIKGMVSYVRELDSGVSIERQGEEIVEMFKTNYQGVEYEFESRLKLVELVMGENQTISYLAACHITNEKQDNFKVADSGAASWVYPDGSWGTEGFARHYTKLSAEDGSWYRPAPAMLEYYHDTDKLRELSVKDAYIIDTIKATRGVVVIYDYNILGGVLDLAIAMDNMGFERFDENESVFISSGRSGKVSFCPTDKTDDRAIRASFKPRGLQGQKPRYAMFAMGKKSSIPHILDIATSYENRNGDYIQVFIITDASKEGISINNMQTFIQRSGVWKASDEQQSLARGIRTNSHDNILKEIADRLEKNGGRREDARFVVKAHLLMARPGLIVPDDDLGRGEDEDVEEDDDVVQVDDDNEINFSYIYRKIFERLQETPKNYDDFKDLLYDREYIESLLTTSTDLYKYRIAQGKNISYHRLLRKLKRASFDCRIHYNRNYRPYEEDNSEKCDYDVCKYECHDPAPDEVDYSTYDVFYIQEAIDSIIEDIKEYFGKNAVGTVQKIMQAIEDPQKLIREKYVSIALTSLVVDRVPIHDRFGYTVYVREDTGVYYTTRDFPTDEIIDNKSMAYYGTTLVGDINIPLKESSREETRRESELLWSELRNIPVTDNYQEDLSEVLKSYKVENEIDIVEKTLLEFANGRDDQMIQAIMDIYDKLFIRMREPVTLIKQKADALRKKSAKKAETEVKSAPTRIDFSKKGAFIKTDANTEVIFFHVMSSHTPERTKYRTLNRIIKAVGVIRVLKPSEKVGWRDANPVETLIYNHFAQLRIREIILPLEDNELYGMVTLDGTFLIRDKSSEDPSAETNHKKTNRGRECTSFDWPSLKNYMWNTGVRDLPKQWRGAPQSAKSKASKDYIKSKTNEAIDMSDWDDEQVTFYYAWSQDKISKEEACELLLGKMEEEGTLLRWRKY